MDNNEKATAAQDAAVTSKDAFSCQATRSEINPTIADIQQAARELAGLSFACVPLNAARVPMLKGWQDSTSDANETHARFARHGVAGLAVVTRDIIVVDLDCGHTPGVDGILNFTDIIERHGAGEPLALGPRVRTRRGGLHAYFRAPPGVSIRSSASKLALGVDIKAGNSLATVPPTAGYRWLKHPCDAAIPLAPRWLIALPATAAPPPRAPSAPLRPFDGREHAYARAALQRECAAVAGCGNGARNASLFKAAASLGALAAGGALSVQAVADALMDAASACGLVADDGCAAVEATIASGLRKGLERPRAIPAGGGR